MCQSVHAYGDEREEVGIEIGMNKGIKIGMNKGILKGKIDTVKNLLDDGITLEKALKLADLDKETYENHKDNIE
jgi:hypothetical protein